MEDDAHTTFSLACVPRTITWELDIQPATLMLREHPVTLRVIGELASIDYYRNDRNGPTIQLELDMVRIGDYAAMAHIYDILPNPPGELITTAIPITI